MQPPNILITNFCNQNCSFCFAAKEMTDKTIDREMELANFEIILKQMKKKSNEKIVKLLGGEPTLHPNFKELIQISFRYFPCIQIFTNGILTEKKASFFSKYFPKIRFTFNVMTPGFLLNKNIRNTVLHYIEDFAVKTQITLSLTLDPFTDIKNVLGLIPPKLLEKVQIFRIGFSNPVAGEKNYYKFEDFPKMGYQLFSLVTYVKKYNQKARLNLNCGFTRCMFTQQQFNYLKENKVEVLGWGCFGKASSMDINPSMQAFHCFPLSTVYRETVTKFNLTKVAANLLKKRYDYWKNIHLSVCKKCPFYGHTPEKCPGPCIAFRLNINH